jgi:hypothetical protein
MSIPGEKIVGFTFENWVKLTIGRRLGAITGKIVILGPTWPTTHTENWQQTKCENFGSKKEMKRRKYD